MELIPSPAKDTVILVYSTHQIADISNTAVEHLYVIWCKYLHMVWRKIILFVNDIPYFVIKKSLFKKTSLNKSKTSK